ncbi:MAG: hypothetical protein DHS20C15_00670 [Planctomycetota bacterium]|nr:MAG: hypothetical protein DHS20C15_00670 [Planctomycetota bacterium]
MATRWRPFLVCVALIALTAACRQTDDARVLQVLNQRGFGRPTLDANRRYYLGIGDILVLRDTGHPEYNGVSEPVRMDGTITLPDVGEVYVNGLTPAEATQVVRQRFDSFVLDTTGMNVEVNAINSKKFYVAGLPPRKAVAIPFTGDTTLIDAMVKSAVDEILVDTDEILVIRGDPEHPFVIACDYDAIVTEGLTRDNITIRENDIVYLTPSITGWFVYGVNILLAPVQPFTQLIFGANNSISATNSFGEGTIGAGNNNKFNNNNGF